MNMLNNLSKMGVACFKEWRVYWLVEVEIGIKIEILMGFDKSYELLSKSVYNAVIPMVTAVYLYIMAIFQ